MENTENQVPVPAASAKERFLTGYRKFETIFGKMIMVLYRLRKVVLAAPVVYYALKLAAYNREHLPELVGLNLQTSGEFALQISRQLAILGPLAITAGCLVMMFLSRKALHSWAISVFTLILPVVLLLSNQYPA